MMGIFSPLLSLTINQYCCLCLLFGARMGVEPIVTGIFSLHSTAELRVMDKVQKVSIIIHYVTVSFCCMHLYFYKTPFTAYRDLNPANCPDMNRPFPIERKAIVICCARLCSLNGLQLPLGERFCKLILNGMSSQALLTEQSRRIISAFLCLEGKCL